MIVEIFGIEEINFRVKIYWIKIKLGKILEMMWDERWIFRIRKCLECWIEEISVIVIYFLRYVIEF